MLLIRRTTLGTRAMSQVALSQPDSHSEPDTHSDAGLQAEITGGVA
jgi:hypothetical protein